MYQSDLKCQCGAYATLFCYGEVYCTNCVGRACPKCQVLTKALETEYRLTKVTTLVTVYAMDGSFEGEVIIRVPHGYERL